jgi:Lamin Tail Domain
MTPFARWWSALAVVAAVSSCAPDTLDGNSKVRRSTPWDVAVRDDALSTGVVISQVYGGGGNAGGIINRDYIEIFNRGTTPVTINGWSVQYASDVNLNWLVVRVASLRRLPTSSAPRT